MSKLYFIDFDDEHCFSKDSILDQMLANDKQATTGHEANIEYKTSYFFCKALNEIGETGDGCGKECNDYSPRNGKNGRCRFHMNCYVPGKAVIFKIENDKLFIKEKS